MYALQADKCLRREIRIEMNWNKNTQPRKLYECMYCVMTDDLVVLRAHSKRMELVTLQKGGSRWVHILYNVCTMYVLLNSSRTPNGIARYPCLLLNTSVTWALLKPHHLLIHFNFVDSMNNPLCCWVRPCLTWSNPATQEAVHQVYKTNRPATQRRRFILNFGGFDVELMSWRPIIMTKNSFPDECFRLFHLKFARLHLLSSLTQVQFCR